MSTSLVSASVVATGQVQSVDSVRAHALPSDALIFTSATKVQPANQNLGSYAIVESGVNSLGVTTTGSVPAVTQSPFADLYKEGSIYFSGAAGNYLQNTATYSNSTIQWNTTGMTLEAWVNYPTFVGASAFLSTNPQPNLIGQMVLSAANNYWSFGANTTGYVNFYYWNGTSQTVMSTTQISANTWNHIAMTCSTSGQIFLFVNGVQTTVISNRNGSFTGSTNFESVQGTPLIVSYPLTIGQYNGLNMNAYVADLRLTTGTPVYTGTTGSLSTFTVPSVPLSSITSPGVTQFLLRAGQNAPTIQNGALTFDRGLKQYMNFGPQTFNIVTQGFTAVWRGAFTGTPGNYETIFEGGLYGTSNGGIFVGRAGTSTGLYFQISASTGTSAVFTVPVASILSQGVQTVIAARYNPATSLADVWVNGVFQASATCSPAALVGDRLLPTSYVGYPYATNSFTSMTSNTFAVYNRALSNVEIYNSYLALSATPQQALNTTVEFGDVNGTPALSIAGDGRVAMTNLGQTSNVLPWPPAAMTGYDTVINGQVYKARASSDGNGVAWYAFDKTSSTVYSSSGNFYTTYNTSSNIYTGTTTTIDVNGNSYLGEWVQLQTPSSIVLSTYQIQMRTDLAPGSGEPKTWAVLGSRDGVNWFLVDQRTNVTWSGAGSINTLTVQSSQAFAHFRLVTYLVGVGTAGGRNVVLAEWTLYGTADTPQTLTVAQPMTLSYGAQTASLTGISGDKYVPHDFSSSGLNIPAYVVSNTATTANTVQYSSFGPFAGEGSLYFQGGKGAYVNFPASTVTMWPGGLTSLGSGTIEMWVYLTKYNVNQTTLIARGVVSGTFGWWLNISSSGVLTFQTYGGAFTTSGGTVTLNAWNHVAVSAASNYVSIFLNGTLVGTPFTYSGTLTGSASDPILISNPSNANYTINGYVANIRLAQGQALYTTSFTPPTGPLQPIQGVTQAGTPYGTVLLLRNAPAPGRVLTQKFGGTNSGSVLAFPPAAMTGYATTLNSGYGQGTYVASASNDVSGAVWQAFDKNTGTIWQVNTGIYTSNTPYSGATKTVDVNGNSYAGEWCQIQMPSSIVLSNYTIYGVGGNMPTIWYTLGSRDGTNWNLVDQRNFNSWSGYTQFNVGSSSGFTYFRFVLNQSNGAQPAIYELIFNGSIEGPNVTADGRLGVGVSNPVQALEVSGNMVVNGTVSAGNPLMFRNRIINGDMRVFQRGTTFSLSGGTAIYTLDRWTQNTVSGATRAVSNVVDVPFRSGFISSANVVATAATTTTEFWLSQNVEMYNVIDLIGSPVVLSFWYKSNRTGNHGVRFNSAGVIPGNPDTFQTFTVFNANTWEYKVLTFNTLIQCTVPGPSTWNGFGIAVNIGPVVFNMGSTSIANGDYFTLTGVQLEKGTVATPFEFRPYGVELQLCQRYFHRNTGFISPMTIISTTNTNQGQAAYKLPVTMRISPALSFTGTPTLDWTSVSYNTVGGLTTGGGTDVVALFAQTIGNGNAGGVTVGQVRYLYANSGNIDFNAEL